MFYFLTAVTIALSFQSTEANASFNAFSQFHTEHDETLRHNRAFMHRNVETREFAEVRYNATKCSARQYIVLEDVTKITCARPEHIICEFSSQEAQRNFVRQAKPGKILMSHRSMPCFESNAAVVLRIKKVSRVDDLAVNVHGIEMQPFELFEHLDAELSTNMLFSRQSQGNSCCGENRNIPTSSEEELSTEQANLETETYVGPWRIPLPSDILWQDQSAARMFCIDCAMHFFPVLKFKIRIRDYKLEEFLLVYESTTVLDLEPHVSFNIRTSGQSLQLYKEFLDELLQQFKLNLYVGGVPIEIRPGVRLGVFMFSAANVEANVGYKATLLGSFKGGIAYDAEKGLQNIASSQFHSAPSNYKLLLGKKCKLYSKPRGEFVSDVNQCARLCNQHAGCQFFSYKIETGFCQLTRECEQEVNTSTDELLFNAFKWEIPDPNPELKGLVSFGFMPEVFLQINRIGGPNMALCIAQTLQLFSYNVKSQCSVSRLDTKVSYLLGGHIHLKVGQTTVLQMEEYLQPIRTYALPITGAFKICPKHKLPEVNLPLPWISDPSSSPKSLADAIKRTNSLTKGLLNSTALSSPIDSSMAARLRKIQGLPVNSAGEVVSGNRLSAFFKKTMSWIMKKINIE
ncbi:hypothetical protein XU18_2890 [Perkinsela sp. CCAP 1560/4]|nr:hypothetical protein XU18_2890 [Perkinsela sp. CCAP 1560/4]|eukprot:KNH06385.1 hypothetical protein XU18_2890 [Perkinsela sp. CCAP 1560/4]